VPLKKLNGGRSGMEVTDKAQSLMEGAPLGMVWDDKTGVVGQAKKPTPEQHPPFHHLLRQSYQ
jgi:hypothetical protein